MRQVGSSEDRFQRLSDFPDFLRLNAPTAAMPLPINKRVAGSGTVTAPLIATKSGRSMAMAGPSRYIEDIDCFRLNSAVADWSNAPSENTSVLKVSQNECPWLLSSAFSQLNTALARTEEAARIQVQNVVTTSTARSLFICYPRLQRFADNSW